METKDFDNLVSQHSRQVLNTALRILRDENAARDVHQEVFLAIWQQRKRYDNTVNWGGYLYRVAIRKAMEQIRKMKAFPITGLQFDHLHSGEQSRPESRVMASEAQQQLSGCISKLADKQAEAFTLVRIEGLSYTKVAAIMECKEETVRVHLHRAVKQLATLMRPYLQEEGQR